MDCRFGTGIDRVDGDSVPQAMQVLAGECANKLAAASDLDRKIMKAYDAKLPVNPGKRVSNTLEAVQKWRAQNKT
jgi:hypothetical protein